MKGFISGRKSCSTSLVVHALCLGSFVLTFVASSELPFLQPLHHGTVSLSTQKQGTQHHHWLRTIFKDQMPWGPSGSRIMDHHHHRVVHEYQARPMTPNCEMRRVRSGHGLIPGHGFHLRGNPGNDAPVHGIFYFHFGSTPSPVSSVPGNGKPTPPGGGTRPPNPSADVLVEVAPPRLGPVNGIVDKPTPSGYPPPPRNPGASVIVEVVSPLSAVVRASRQ